MILLLVGYLVLGFIVAFSVRVYEHRHGEASNDPWQFLVLMIAWPAVPGTILLDFIADSMKNIFKYIDTLAERLGKL